MNESQSKITQNFKVNKNRCKIVQNELSKGMKVNQNQQNNLKFTKISQNESKITKIERIQWHKINQNESNVPNWIIKLNGNG